MISKKEKFNYYPDKLNKIEKGIKIEKQGWYQEVGKIWHTLEEFNMVGEHITILNIGRKWSSSIDKVFFIRNYQGTVTIEFKNGDYFNFPVLNNTFYWTAKLTILSRNKIQISIPLSWYCLGYKHSFIGRRYTKEQLNGN